MSQVLIFTHDTASALTDILQASPRSAFILADSNTAAIARTLQSRCPALADAPVIVIEAGDSNKTLAAVEHLWQKLVDFGATRRSVLVNIGGGMVTDLGGFAAATFKRGISWINVPTTLLGAVDAAVGGKTGINFAGLKNEIGVFAEAAQVVISTEFFDTLPAAEVASGYAEMLKHALLSGPGSLNRALEFDLRNPDLKALLPLLEESVEVKRRIVAEDPHEHGIRRALNLGHTIGHAIESLMMERGTPVPHGHAVAWGLVGALVISYRRSGFPSDTLHRVADYVYANYPAMPVRCTDYDRLIALMRHDKKNPTPEAISFTLLSAPGAPIPGQTTTPEEIQIALDLTRDLLRV